MKLLAVVLFAALLAVTYAGVLDCKKVGNVSEDAMNKFRKGEVEVDNEELGKRLLCFSKQKGVVTEDNKVNTEIIKKFMVKTGVSEADADASLKSCDQTEPNANLYINKFGQCLYNKHPELPWATADQHV